jgi:hypothetical protein
MLPDPSRILVPLDVSPLVPAPISIAHHLLDRPCVDAKSTHLTHTTT